MNFSDHNVTPLIKSSDAILIIGRFANNDQDHFYSLSADTQMTEWIYGKDYFEGILSFKLSFV
jgi:hypothetical protein